ncbi:MAG: polysaccharide lyase family 8 super-sandwich domain-containing protein [Planctomycetota bacterium]
MRTSLTAAILLLLLAHVRLAAAGVYEAEAATLHGAEISVDKSASGGSRVSHVDAVGDSLTFATVDAGSWLRIGYALGRAGEARCTVRFGDAPPMLATFRPTGAWTRYATVLLPMPAAATRVTLRIEPDDQAFNANASCASFDYIETLAAAPAELHDMAVLAGRITAPQGAAPGPASLATSLRDDGSWPDINYEAVGTTHFDRTRQLAARLHADDATDQDNAVCLAAVHRALRYWFEHDFRDPNWWVNEVAVPKALADTVLLLGDRLDPALRKPAARILYRAWPPPEGSGKGRGANLFYRMHTAIRLALWMHDAGMLRYVCQRAADEIYITTADGIQADYSFHQHGPQLYSGSYGLEFIGSAAALHQLGAGTCFALPDDKVALVSALILDHLQFMIRGRMIDPAAQGRNFSRPGFIRGADVVAQVSRTFAACNVPRAAEFVALADRIEGKADATPWPDANRMFWRSDFLCHSRAGWYVSAKMASTRTLGSEGGNGEGLRQYHLADGACFVLSRGDEYADMPPIMDWRRVPGITCEQDNDAWPRIDWGLNMLGKTRFAGGVSDGRVGMAALDFRKDRVVARKAWFFFDDAAVCLGAGISCSGDAPVVTTLNQCRRNGAVTVGGEAIKESRALHGPTSVEHDGIRYTILGEANVTLTLAARSGSWHDINHRYGSDEMLTRDVFTLGMDHGVKPDGAGYAYVLQPAASTLAAQVAGYRVVSNTPAVQAVAHDGWLMAAFVAADILMTDDWTVGVNRGCTLMLAPANKPGERRLLVALPDYDMRKPAQTLQMMLPGSWRVIGDSATCSASVADGTTTLTIRCNAGATTTVDIAPADGD